jgi:hypothetical protein
MHETKHLFLVAIFAVLFSLLISGCTSQPKNSKEFKSAQYGIDFKYPAYWEIVENPSEYALNRSEAFDLEETTAALGSGTMVKITAFKWGAGGRAEVTQLYAPNTNLEEYKKSFVDGFQKSLLERFNVTASFSDLGWQAIDGISAYSIEGATTTGGYSTTSKYVLMVRNDYIYQFVFTEYSQNYGRRSADFDEMLKTVKFS